MCDCPIQCFNCVYHNKPGKGHLTINDRCPLKKCMQNMTSTQTTATTTAPPLAPPAQPPWVDKV
jgi:hypothetical protein